MGSLWLYDGGTWRSSNNISAQTGTGWAPGRYVWRHDGTSWVQVWQRDTTPPAAPTVALSIVGGTKNVVSVTISTPPAPIIRTVVKVGVNSWASNPTSTTDGYYYAQQINGEEWSEYWKGSQSYGAGLTGTKYIPASYQTFSFPLSTPICVSAWCQDDYYNWSSAGTSSIATLAPDPPAPVLRTLSSYVNAGDSCTRNRAITNSWSSQALSDGYLSQGGSYGCEGFWWYGDALRATLAPAVSINTMQLLTQRVNSAHGVSGQALFRLGAHQMQSRPAGDPGLLMGCYDFVLLSRGQAYWESVTSGWWGQYQSGYLTGFGIGGVGSTSYTSNLYGIMYGRGTTSGQVYMEWQQY
jgi:hypothetical protein